MRKIARKDGGSTLVFERGDKMRRRYKRYVEEWRGRLPDPVRYSNGRMLRHRPEWYLEDAHILARPSIGIASLARFAEWLLYTVQKRKPGGREHALAARLFRLVQRRMRAYMYKCSLDANLSDKGTKWYLGACRAILPLAREAHAAYEAMRLEQKPKLRVKRPLDAIHKDMI